MNLLKKILSLVVIPGFLIFVHEAEAQAPPIVFVSRNLQKNGNQYYPQSGLLPGMGPFSRFKVVGGRLLVRKSNGSTRTLVDSIISFNGITLIDVQQPRVLWNASKIVFSGIEHPDSSWRIYEINSDGSGFRKITFTNRTISLTQFGTAAYKFVKYDDIDPCYLPDGRICFASTRYPSLSEMGFRTTNIYIINSDLSNLHRITTERNGAEKPSIDPSGRIVYSRWWLNYDMPAMTSSGLTRDSLLSLSLDVANIWQTAVIRPDGDALKLYAGHPESRLGLSSYKPVILNDSVMLSMFVPHSPMAYTSGSTGIRWFNKGVDYPHYIAGVNQNNMQLYITNPPSIGTMIPPYAADPIQLPDGKILFSYASNVENQDYGLYTININGTGIQLIYDIPGKLELNAQVLMPRTVPPVLQDFVTDISDELPPTDDPNTYFQNGGFRFDCVNIYINGDVDQPITDAPPITKDARIDFFLNFQRRDTSGLDSSIKFHSLPVDYSGGVHFDLAPADVSMFEQVVDSTGKVLKGTKGQIAHVTGMNFGRPGTGTKCAGCHAGHTTIPVPPTITEAQFTNLSTSANVTESSFKQIDTIQYKGNKVVDRKARNDSLTVNWIANGTQDEFVELNWNLPLDVRWLKLYNIKPNPVNNTNIQVTDCEIFLYYQNIIVSHINSTGQLSVNGTQVNISGLPKIDKAKIIVKSFIGLINGLSLAGLAEVETNARISFYEVNGIKQITSIAKDFYLSQNYPNPFNPSTKIKFSIPANSNGKISNVKLVIYDIQGKEISKLINQSIVSGTYEIEWNASAYATGVYFYRLEANGFSDVKKMVVLK
jgi:hypothetical protein